MYIIMNYRSNTETPPILRPQIAACLLPHRCLAVHGVVEVTPHGWGDIDNREAVWSTVANRVYAQNPMSEIEIFRQLRFQNALRLKGSGLCRLTISPADFLGLHDVRLRRSERRSV